jgi:hypothetical protein
LMFQLGKPVDRHGFEVWCGGHCVSSFRLRHARAASHAQRRSGTSTNVNPVWASST